jgi:hypothetical protein
MVIDEPDRRTRLWENQGYFVTRMAELPYPLVSTDSPIVPILIGDEDAADALARSLGESGIHVDAVRFPAVPLRKARLRIQLNAGHTHQDIDQLIDTLRAHQHRASTTIISTRSMTKVARGEPAGNQALSLLRMDDRSRGRRTLTPGFVVGCWMMSGSDTKR